MGIWGQTDIEPSSFIVFYSSFFFLQIFITAYSSVIEYLNHQPTNLLKGQPETSDLNDDS